MRQSNIKFNEVIIFKQHTSSLKHIFILVGFPTPILAKVTCIIVKHIRITQDEICWQLIHTYFIAPKTDGC